MNARKKRQIDAELAMMGMQATDGPGQYVTVQIEGPDGPEVYKAWACAVEHTRTRRHNPPLPEHMAHEALRDITKLLATRIIAETTARGRDCYGDFIYELSSQIRRQLRDTGLAFGDDERALDLLTDAEEVCSLFNQYRPLAHLLK